MRSPHVARRTAAGLAAAVALLAIGCSDKHTVRGIVRLDDGTPLSKGLIVGERIDGGPPVTARGEIRPDGRFELSTEVPGDGVLPGRYVFLINPLDLSDVPDELKDYPFDLNYLRFNTSGLEYEVVPGENEFAIVLNRRPTTTRR